MTDKQEAGVRSVLAQHFQEELCLKKRELQIVEERIQLARLMLHRLRLGILAQSYSLAAFCPPEDYSAETVGAQRSWEAFEKSFLQPPSQRSSPGPCREEQEREAAAAAAKDEKDSGTGVKEEGEEGEEGERDREGLGEEGSGSSKGHETSESMAVDDSTSRFYVKERVIVGNTSQFIPPEARSTDGSTHKWMVYVRGPTGEPNIGRFVKRICFFLHPSYHPSDIVYVSRPPFHLTRLGWGEFPVRVQLEFQDARNKPADIIHNLVLDRTHTGQQTLGSETVVDLDIVEAPAQNGTTVPLRGCCAGTEEGPGNNIMVAAPIPSPTPSVSKPTPCASKPTPYNNNNNISKPISTPTPCKPNEEPLPSADTNTFLQTDPFQCVVVPTSSLTDHILLDHDYCTTVVVSKRDVPGAKLPPKGRHPSAAVALEQRLHQAAQGVPMYGQPASEQLPLAAGSLEELRGWNIGRRRAVEWMRAVAVRQMVREQTGGTGQTGFGSGSSAQLSTRQVMEWCRKHGYTPLDPALQDCPGFCKWCGCQLPLSSSCSCPEGGGGGGRGGKGTHESCSPLPEICTLTSPLELFSELMEQGEGEGGRRCVVELVSVDDDEEEEEEEEKGEREGEGGACSRGQLALPAPKFRVPQTPELKWVQQTAAGVGVRVYPAVLERLYAHVVEHMLFMACSKFLRAVLSEAVREAGRGSGREDTGMERVILPSHLHLAIGRLEVCDFLTSRYMGLQSSTDT